MCRSNRDRLGGSSSGKTKPPKTEEAVGVLTINNTGEDRTPNARKHDGRGGVEAVAGEWVDVATRLLLLRQGGVSAMS